MAHPGGKDFHGVKAFPFRGALRETGVTVVLVKSTVPAPSRILQIARLSFHATHATCYVLRSVIAHATRNTQRAIVGVRTRKVTVPLLLRRANKLGGECIVGRAQLQRIAFHAVGGRRL